ncbi:MAG: hypothetical protein ABSE07_09850 [Methanoregula sp.]|jgi:hypothetical protein
MGRVTLHFSEEEYQLFHHYCTNYCRLFDETRKNSIKILLELYKHQVIDIQGHNLDNVFLFFYQKKQEFEIESQVPGSDANEQMRLRICTDIIAFLEDLEKIYRLLRKKGVDANYYLIIGAFSKISDEEARARMEDLHKTSAHEINAIVSPLGKAIEKKLGPDVDTRILLGKLAGFVELFNRLSPDLIFNDEITDLIAISLLRMFGKEETDEEIPALLKGCRDQIETDELESALEGNPRTQDAWDLDFSWEEFLKPLHTLNERIAQGQIPMGRSLEVLSALEAPVKIKPAQADYSPVTLYQNPGLVRRRYDENRILVKVDNRPHSEVQVAPAADYISVIPSQDYHYKKYFSLTFGVMILVILVLVSAVFSLSSAPGTDTGNSTEGLAGISNVTSAGSSLLLEPAPMITPIPPLLTLEPTPEPTPQYVTIEPVIPEPDTGGPVSHRKEYDQLALVENFLFNPNDYVTIYENNYEYNPENAYKISFDLKNPPMIIRYNVIPHNITDVKWFEPRDAAKLIDTATIDRPDEFARFEVKINKDSTLYDQEGWGRIYGDPLSQQEIVIRDAGEYQIEFSGDLATVNTEVLVKRAGNI